MISVSSNATVRTGRGLADSIQDERRGAEEADETTSAEDALSADAAPQPQKTEKPSNKAVLHR